MTEIAIFQLISGSGAAIVLFWVITQLMSGKLHTQSEVDVYAKQASEDQAVIKTLTDQFRAINDLVERRIG